MKKYLLTAALCLAAGSMLAADATELWAGAEKTSRDPFYAPGWQQITTYTFDVTDNGMSITLPEATSEQWQAQFGVDTKLSLNADKYYKFSFDIEINTRFVPYFKLFQTGVDGNMFCEGKLSDVEPGTPYHYSYTAKGNGYPELTLLFDFGGNPANTEVKITNISLLESDEAFPEEPKEPEGENGEVTELWVNATKTPGEVYFSPNWAPNDNYSCTWGNDTFEATLIDATNAVWQAQFPIVTDIALDAETYYAFAADINCDQTTTMHIKLVQAGDTDADKGNFIIDQDVNLAANEPVEFFKAVKGQELNPLSLYFDFGRNPANTNIKVSNIRFWKSATKIYTKPSDSTTGVAGIAVGDGAVEYYNLQGMRVAAPAQGQMVIMRKAGKTSKVVF